MNRLEIGWEKTKLILIEFILVHTKERFFQQISLSSAIKIKKSHFILCCKFMKEEESIKVRMFTQVFQKKVSNNLHPKSKLVKIAKFHKKVGLIWTTKRLWLNVWNALKKLLNYSNKWQYNLPRVKQSLQLVMEHS